MGKILVFCSRVLMHNAGLIAIIQSTFRRRVLRFEKVAQLIWGLLMVVSVALVIYPAQLSRL